MFFYILNNYFCSKSGYINVYNSVSSTHFFLPQILAWLSKNLFILSSWIRLQTIDAQMWTLCVTYSVNGLRIPKHWLHLVFFRKPTINKRVCVVRKKRNKKARKIEQKKNSIRSRSGRWRRSVFPTVPLFRVVGLRLSLLCCTPPRWYK